MPRHTTNALICGEEFDIEINDERLLLNWRLWLQIERSQLA